MAAGHEISQELLVQFMLEALQQTRPTDTQTSLQSASGKKLAAKFFQEELHHGVNLRRDRLMSVSREATSQRVSHHSP